MKTNSKSEEVLGRYRAALSDLYGDRLERVVLFGSRARGEARLDSDFDVAVFLQPQFDRWAEFDRLARLRVRFIDESGAFFEALPFAADAYAEKSPLMHAIRSEGVDL